jgi:hypothetical protein
MVDDATLQRNLPPFVVSTLSGAPTQTLANWRYQKLLDGIGEFDETSQQWNYSVVDAIKVCVISHLATIGVRLPFAVAIAGNVDQRVAQLAAAGGYPEQVIGAWQLDDKNFTVVVDRAEKVFKQASASIHPIIVVPIDALTFAVFDRVSLWKVAEAAKVPKDVRRPRAKAKRTNRRTKKLIEKLKHSRRGAAVDRSRYP